MRRPLATALGALLVWGFAGATDAPGLWESYRVATANGIWIDAMEGRMETVGRVRKSDKVEPGTYQGRLMAERALEEARKQLLAAVVDLRIDDERLLGQDEEVMRRVRDLIAGLEAKAVRYDQNLYVEADVVLPLRGLSGVLGMILERGAPSSAPPGAAAGEEAATGLIVDAGSLPRDDAGPVVALLPRIVDEEGRIVYDIAQADGDIARERGLVAYVQEIRPLTPDASSRVGERPLRVTAVAAGGAGRTDIVIAASDADRILEAAAVSPFLHDCRVVVLMPAPPLPPAIVRPRKPPARQVDPNKLH